MLFYRIRQKLPDKCLKSIYFAFVYPYLLHGIEVYANTRPTHLSKLMILSNKILRILPNKSYRSPVKDLYTFLKVFLNQKTGYCEIPMKGMLLRKRQIQMLLHLLLYAFLHIIILLAFA